VTDEIGTGGTISGISDYLLPRLPNLLVVLADPQGSGLYNSIKFGVMYSSTEKEGTRRRHQVDSLVEGIGLNRLTRNFEVGQRRINEAVRVTDAMAVAMGRWLVQNDGSFYFITLSDFKDCLLDQVRVSIYAQRCMSRGS
jgi:cysteine synthase